MTSRIAVVLVVIAALAGAWWLLQILGMPPNLSPDALATWLQSQGAVGPLLLMLLMLIAVVVGPIPTLPVSATAGLAFGV
ncbi:MAG: TVP38/TMEM64 family protein, partial [Marinobacter sp.]|nr:TVP38/TMEM64 family protein [Marinobacter sp.]